MSTTARNAPAAPGDTIFGRYQISHLLGENRVGWVFAADDVVVPAAPCKVAITLFRREHAAEGSPVRRLREGELQLLRAIELGDGTTNVVRPIEPSVRDGKGVTASIVALVDGAPLRELMTGRSRLAPLQVCRLGEGLARALTAVHAAGGGGCALEPGDILVRRGDEAVLVDLHLAKREAEADAEADRDRLAPEERDGAPRTPAGDLYRLGALLRELLAEPATGSSGGYRQRSMASNLGGPRAVVALVERCLDPQPQNRPSALEATAVLKKAARRWVKVALTVGGLVAGGAALAYLCWTLQGS